MIIHNSTATTCTDMKKKKKLKQTSESSDILRKDSPICREKSMKKKKTKGKLIKIIEDLTNKIIEKYIREKNVLVA